MAQQGKFEASPLLNRPSVWVTPVRGPYWPVMMLARLGMQADSAMVWSVKTVAYSRSLQKPGKCFAYGLVFGSMSPTKSRTCLMPRANPASP